MADDSCFIDTSVIVAIAIREAGWESAMAKMEQVRRRAVGAPSLVEAIMVLGPRFGYDPRPWIEEFIRTYRIDVIAFEYRHYQAASEAYLRYGKGRHPARLNYGDCMAYAGATLLNWPLLYIGGDFGLTDVRSALN